MHKGIREAEAYRQTAFVTQVGQQKFISCWMGNRLGEAKSEREAVSRTVAHLRIHHAIKRPTVVTINLAGKRHAEVFV